MTRDRAYRTELDPNEVQRTLLVKSCGAARWAYNWGLQRKNEVHMMNQLPVPHIKYPTAIDLHRELNLLKKTAVPWMYEVSKCAPQEALRDLDTALKSFFEGRAKYPRFKSKKLGLGSFTLTGSIAVSDRHIVLPRIGRLRLKERGYLPMDRHVRAATVSEKAGRWFVSVAFTEDIETPVNTGGIIGVDFGINRLATCSDGTAFENPKALTSCLQKVKRLHREVSRKRKGSANRKKATRRLATVMARTANVRKDALHQMTTRLARTNSVIVIEDLGVKNMLKNHSIACAIADVGWGEARRQLTYKTQWYGSRLVIAGRFYPSSKTCSGCGAVKDDLPLSVRVYDCETCHSKMDRDHNAAVNLSRLTASSDGSIMACSRREVSGDEPQCPSMTQEMNAAIPSGMGG